MVWLVWFFVFSGPTFRVVFPNFLLFPTFRMVFRTFYRMNPNVKSGLDFSLKLLVVVSASVSFSSHVASTEL